MYTRRNKKGSEGTEASDLADKHQKFVEKMQNPEDDVDGNVLGSSKASPINRSFTLDELPDGSHISPIKVTPRKDRKSVKEVEYIGSFCVTGDDQNQRADYVKSKLVDMRDVQKRKSVLLVISLSGIKVCSSTGEDPIHSICTDSSSKSVFMAHALKRISYATCDPQFCQFSFLAREPKSDTSIQYCHAFVTQSAEEAEELNAIIGNAFKLAFAYQREEQENQQPTFQQVIAQQISDQQKRTQALEAQKHQQLQNRLSVISTPTVDEQMKERKETRKKQQEELERQKEEALMRGKERLAWAKNIVGRAKHKTPYSGNNSTHTLTNGTSSTSSPHHRLSDTTDTSTGTHGQTTPPIFRNLLELRDLLNSSETRTYGSPVMTLKETIDHRYEMNGGFSLFDDESDLEDKTLTKQSPNMSSRPLPDTPGTPPSEGSLSSRRHSEPFQNNTLTLKPESQENGNTNTTQPPPKKMMPVRQASLPSMSTGELSIANSESQKTSWYQKGIEREVALEYLSQQEMGSFIVRDSSTHKGCYALSIKVPKYENPSGISHYLILKTAKGNVQLKGIDKEWPDLLSLVMHHSVAREVLPCLLRFPTRANNPVFGDDVDAEEEENDEDEDYRKFSDCSAMMQQLRV